MNTKLAMMAVALAGAINASASVELVTNPGGQQFMNTPPPGTEGFSFTTGANPLVYNEYGVYDWGNDGLGASHVVTLFTASGDIVGSATVPSGGGSTADSFQWVQGPTITLTPNTTYVLAASYTGNDPDDFWYGSATLSGATLDNAVWESGGTQVFPDQVWGSTGQGFFGPNLSFSEIPPVPEPTTIISAALMLLPFGASTLRIMRRKQVA